MVRAGEYAAGRVRIGALTISFVARAASVEGLVFQPVVDAVYLFDRWVDEVLRDRR